jgi:hypothetical protein
VGDKNGTNGAVGLSARPGGGTPDLGQFLRYRPTQLHVPPAWIRGIKAEWFGAYTPPFVPFYILKLMREDPQLSLGLGAVKSVFFGIDYRLGGGDKRARAFAQKTIREARWFDWLVKSILNAIDFGFQAHEILWALEPVTFDEDGPGGVSPETINEAYVVEGFLDVDPEHVSGIALDEKRRLAALSVFADVASAGVLPSAGIGLGAPIPGEKVLHAVHELEWGNHWGNAVLKRAYLPTLWANHLYVWHMRYMEGKANPPYVGHAPPDNSWDEDKSLDGQVSKNNLDILAAAGMALRGGGFASLPSVLDEKGNQLWSIEVLEDGGRTDQFVTSINHMQALKLRSIFLPERAATQDTATGSFAMADAHVDMFLAILEGIKRHTVLETLNTLTERVVRANFGRATSMPRWEASDLGRQKQKLLEELVKQSLEVPLSLDDGRTYTVAQLIDFTKTLESVNVPSKKPSEVARKPAPAPTAPAQSTPASSPPAGPAPGGPRP